jgi:hypothetical protein
MYLADNRGRHSSSITINIIIVSRVSQDRGTSVRASSQVAGRQLPVTCTCTEDTHLHPQQTLPCLPSCGLYTHACNHPHSCRNSRVPQASLANASQLNAIPNLHWTGSARIGKSVCLFVCLSGRPNTHNPILQSPAVILAWRSLHVGWKMKEP